MKVKRAAQDEEIKQGSAKKRLRAKRVPGKIHGPFFGEGSEAARAKRWRDRFKAAGDKAALDVLKAEMQNMAVAAPPASKASPANLKR